MGSSSFLGNPNDHWSLARAVDSLAASARTGGVPGLVWIAGACYPGINLNVDLLRAVLGLAENYTRVDLPGAGSPELIVGLFTPDIVGAQIAGREFWAIVWLLVGSVVLARLVMGLAKISDPRVWETSDREVPYAVESGLVRPASLERRRNVRLRTAWRAGHGLGFVGLGLWGMLVLLLLGAGLVLIAPVVVLMRSLALENTSSLFAGLLIPSMIVLLAYAAVLMVINQLALHSLAHNRRGVASALTHAWRIVRASPMSVLRATVVDFVLAISIVVLATILDRVIDTLSLPGFLSSLGYLCLYGFAGVTRAGFWSRAYRALGGLSSADRVPGL